MTAQAITSVEKIKLMLIAQTFIERKLNADDALIKIYEEIRAKLDESKKSRQLNQIKKLIKMLGIHKIDKKQFVDYIDLIIVSRGDERKIDSIL